MNCCHPALFDLKLLDHSFVSYIHYRNNIYGDINVILLLLYSFIWISVLISLTFFSLYKPGDNIGVYSLYIRFYILKGEMSFCYRKKKNKMCKTQSKLKLFLG